MLLLEDELEEMKPIECPTPKCKEKLPLGYLTKECPTCGQLFLGPLLFPEAHNEVKQQKGDKVEI